MKVRWSPDAQRDLTEIVDFIWQDSPKAARRMHGLFRTAALRLVTTPFMGRPGLLPNTRELIPHPSYRLVYQVQGDTIRIISLMHTARRWPPVEDES